LGGGTGNGGGNGNGGDKGGNNGNGGGNNGAGNSGNGGGNSGNAGGKASSTGSGIGSSGDDDDSPGNSGKIRGTRHGTGVASSTDDLDGPGNSGKAKGKRADKVDTISLDDDTTAALIGSGWSPTVGNGPFRNHGARVSTLVGLAKELGYGANVGAMQANFGTPQETGIRALQERIADLKADPLADPHLIDALEAELADKIQHVKPGAGPTGDWETANLDVDGNGVVDDRDLDLARRGFRPFD
jgi:hypothetical protein